MSIDKIIEELQEESRKSASDPRTDGIDDSIEIIRKLTKGMVLVPEISTGLFTVKYDHDYKDKKSRGWYILANDSQGIDYLYADGVVRHGVNSGGNIEAFWPTEESARLFLIEHYKEDE